MSAVRLTRPALSVAVARTATADPDVPLPAYQSEGAAGLDFRANLAAGERAAGIRLAPGERALIPTGLRIALPEGYELQVRPRSGLALSQGVTVLNSPGTVDSDYRGEIGVLLINLGSDAVLITHGSRIAQGVLAPVTPLVWDEVALLDATGRGGGGFGSTGR